MCWARVRPTHCWPDPVRGFCLRADISRRLKEAGALSVVADADGLAEAVGDLLQDAALRLRMVAAGHTLVEKGRGALAQTLQMINDDLPVPMPDR